MRSFVWLLVLGRVAFAEPPASHDVGVVAGAGANISATGGMQLELGVHVRDTVALAGSATMMGEWYHADVAARWFPMQGEWQPYLVAAIGQLNDQDLFEDFIAIGAGLEHRSASGHWAIFGEAAVDNPYSARRSGMSVSARPSPEGALGVRYYY
ncbi:MAG: hypothetical protein ACM31C_11400 [Acidobacteriota bacterium]